MEDDGINMAVCFKALKGNYEGVGPLLELAIPTILPQYLAKSVQNSSVCHMYP